MKIRFKIDREEEKRMLFRFSKKDCNMRAGYNLFKLLIHGREKELKSLPKIETAKRKKLIDAYIEREYKNIKNITKLKRLKKKIEINWNKVSPVFFREIEKVFDGHKFPKGNYTAYLTIFPLCPHNIKKKTFQIGTVSKNASNANWVIVHELMHFMFFDYLNKHFKRRLNKDLEWDFSEIINAIIQNKPPFNKMYKEKPKPYPKHKKRYKILNKLYNQCSSMHEFFEKAIKILKTEKE